VVRLDRIRRTWEDFLHVAGSLKRGTVRASELMRALLTTGRPSTLARAIADLGRIPTTLHLLRLITDAGYRRKSPVFSKGDIRVESAARHGLPAGG
jgi:TnpA family transposase